MKKRIINFILTAAIILSPAAIFAEDTTNNIIYTDGKTAESFEQRVYISARKGGEFIVAVPKVVNIESGVDMSLKVGIYADIEPNKMVVVAPVDSTPDDTPDVCNFTIENVVSDGIIGRDDIYGVITTKKTDFPYNDPDICTDRNDITNPESTVEILTYRADFSAGEWAGNITLNVSLRDYVGEPPAGLYDADNNLLCTWDESGIDVEQNYTYINYGTETTSGHYILTNVYPDTVKVVIPDSVTSIGEYAFSYCRSLTSVTIPNSVTTIGGCAFYHCEGLTSIAIPNNVISIGTSAFEGCDNLESAVLSNGLKTIGNSAFDDCDSLGSVIIPDSVTLIDVYAFECCPNLTSIVIPDSVTYIGHDAFYDCTSLNSVTIGNSVTHIGNETFSGCDSLTSVIFKNPNNWYAGGVEISSDDLSDASVAARYLTDNYVNDDWNVFIEASGEPGLYDANGTLLCTWEESGIDVEQNYEYDENDYPVGETSGYYVLKNNYQDTRMIIMPDGVTSIGDLAFSNCYNLLAVKIPDSVTSIGNNAFEYCDNLAFVTLENPNNWWAIENNEYMSLPEYLTTDSSGLAQLLNSGFMQLTRLDESPCEYGYYDENNTLIISSLDMMYMNISEDFTESNLTDNPINFIWMELQPSSKLTKIILPEGITHLGDYVFAGLSNLEVVELPASLKSIGQHAFDGTSLQSVVFKNPADWFVGDSVGSMTTGLSESDLSTASTAAIYLKDTYKGKFWTQELEPGLYDANSNLLVSWEESGIDVEQNYVCGDDFYPVGETTGYRVLKDNYPETRLIIMPNDVAFIGENAFAYCTNLTAIKIPSSVMSIEKSAFAFCRSLTSITIPSSITSIGSYAFYCSSLTSATIENVDGWYVGSSTGEKETALSSSDLSSTSNAATYLEDTYYNKYWTCDPDYVMPGLYDADNNLLCTWDASGINVENDYTFSNTSTDTSSLRYVLANNYPATTKVVIPSTVTRIGDYAFSSQSNLTSVTIPDSVTSIGKNAFCYCSSLTSITIPDGVTGIEEFTFSGCNKLKSITIPEGVEYIGKDVFYNCDELITVDLSSSLKTIGENGFQSCDKLETITGAEGLEETGYQAFQSCEKLKSVPHFERLVTLGDFTFENCYALEGISFSSNLRTIGRGTFRSCRSLANVEFEEGLERIGPYAFEQCKALNNVDLPNSLTTIETVAFQSCTSLESIIIPDNVTVLESGIFAGCTKLANVTLHDNITDIGGGVFRYTPWLTSRSEENPLVCYKDFILIDGYKAVGDITIPESVTIVCDGAFSDNTNITSVKLPSGVTEIRDSVFRDCSNLTSVTIPDSTTSIGDYAFYKCTGLTSVAIPDSVTSIGRGTFANCENLTAVVIPDSVTSIGIGAFDGCSDIHSITIPEGVTSIGHAAFLDCINLTSVTFNNQNNWYVGDSSGAKDTALSSSDLLDTSTAATYLTSTYCNKHWTLDTSGAI